MSALFQAAAGSFLAPAFFGFLGLIPVVILLYLLKLRRTQVVISSTLLWRKSLQDLTANAPFQRLRRNLLLLLQIIVLLLVVAALARPFIRADATGGDDICLLFDRSASMQTLENGRARLDLAKGKALEIVDDMAGSDKMMIVTFERGSDVLCELTDDRRRLRAAIRSITASDTPTRVRDSVLVASSLQASTPDLRIVILSDGKIADLEDIGARAFDVSFLQVGATSNNAGIVAFSVRDPLEGVGQRQCLVLVSNDRPEPLETTLTLYLEDETIAVEEVAVPAKDVAEVVFALPDLDTGVLRAELDHDDALAVDNTAWLVLRPASAVKVLLVAKGDSTAAYFLKRVLALNPRVEAGVMEPENYTGRGDYDLVIFDGFAPDTLPDGASVFFNALPPVEGLGEDGVIENPPVIATDPDHPVMRFLNPQNVDIAKARRLVLPDGARPLVSTQGAPLLADVSRGGRQVLVVAFDLADTNWPLRLSFPLFMQNLVAWVPTASLAEQTYVATGEPITIVPTPDATAGTVTLPGGATEAIALDPTRPTYFGNTARAGLYTVQHGEQVERHAANLLDFHESAVTPAAALEIGRSEVAAERDRIRQNRELWRWLVLAALAVLAAEWWVYSRRAWL